MVLKCNNTGIWDDMSAVHVSHSFPAYGKQRKATHINTSMSSQSHFNFYHVSVRLWNRPQYNTRVTRNSKSQDYSMFFVYSKSIILSRAVSWNLLKDRLRHHPPAPLSTEASPPATVHPSRHVFATVQMPHPADFSHGFQTSPKQENRTWPRLFQTWVGSFNKKSWPKSITSIWHEPSRPPTSHVHHRWAAVWVLLVDLHEKNPFFFVGF